MQLLIILVVLPYDLVVLYTSHLLDIGKLTLSTTYTSARSQNGSN
jgi:hypothetical protein